MNVFSLFETGSERIFDRNFATSERFDVLLNPLPVVGLQEVCDASQPMLQLGTDHLELTLNCGFGKLVRRDAENSRRFLESPEGFVVLEVQR